MRFSFFIAWRYFLTKKNHQAIHIISYIAVIGITIGTFAMIVVLSAFNGLQQLVESLYSSFDPDIKIEAASGKTFTHDSLLVNKILAIDGVISCIPTLEETVLIKNKDKQTIATLKGVTEEFKNVSGIDSFMIHGNYLLQHNHLRFCIMGYNIAASLNLFQTLGASPLFIYAARPNAHNISINPDNAFRIEPIEVAGVFGINPDFDNKYVIAPLDFVRDVTSYPNQNTALEVDILNEDEAQNIKEKIEKIVGSSYVVRTRYQLNEIIYRTNATEKWITFFILSFILVIAAFNITSSLSMMMIDKTKDIKIFRSLGADPFNMIKIFFFQGMLINLLGFLIGTFLGGITIILQEKIGLIPLKNGIVEYYPVKFLWDDIGKILLIVLSIGFLASYLPARIFVKKIFTFS